MKNTGFKTSSVFFYLTHFFYQEGILVTIQLTRQTMGIRRSTLFHTNV